MKTERMRSVIAGTTKKSMKDELLAVMILQECPASTCSKQLATEKKAFRDKLVDQDAAPKTLNRRISSVSSFYK
jgi:hypothetical protein